MLFFPSRDEAYVHYDMVAPVSTPSTRGRAFAKLIGNGYTTPNLADPNEESCFGDTIDGKGKIGNWHQGSNALKLVLCTRGEAKAGRCSENEQGKSVHFAVMHRKFSNDWQLPLRYERWFVVWEGKAPFRLLAKSRYPVLFANETAGGWTAKENWEGDVLKEASMREGRWVNGTGSSSSSSAMPWLNGSSEVFAASGSHTGHNDTKTDPSHIGGTAEQNWAYFTYTPSIAWAWRPKSAEIRREDRDGGAEDGSYLHSLHVGYLDDEVIVGIGLEDTEQAFAKAEARTLLQCLEVCPGARTRNEDA